MSKKLLICDLDNTLYDWVGYFVPSFYAMVDKAVSILECDRETLLDDFRSVHRAHHDTEHPFSLLETKTVKRVFPNMPRKEIAKRLDPAFHAFNSSRKQTLRLYPDVKEGLEALSRSGVTLVAHTESRLYAALDRLTRLGIADHFSRIYCRERPISEHPDGAAAAKWLRGLPMQKVTELSHHQKKPDPSVVLEICNDEEVVLENVVYVGDSLARDMLMAKQAQVFAVLAKYGTKHRPGDYEKLVRVTHWTEGDVAREKYLKEQAQSISVDYVLERSFAEILSIWDHVPGAREHSVPRSDH